MNRNVLAYFLLLSIAISYCAPAIFARTFVKALPGYQFVFPRDHASHEEYKTEWWYYTGHLLTADKKRYGFELTFFRIGQDQPAESKNSAWRNENLYLAHFAISDENAKVFHFYEKLNRDTLNIASASNEHCYVVNEGWLTEQLGNNMYLKADTPDFGINLLLQPEKPPVVHGKNGVSQKASCKGCASHYYSMTRLKTDGLLIIKGKPISVSGITWMDHEFGSNQLSEKQVGWDWFSMQLDNNVDIMLYLMRKSDGSLDPNSSGTIVHADGQCEHLSQSQFSVAALNKWKSPATKAIYPMGWQISIPAIKGQFTIMPAFREQELVTTRSTGVTYWEGSCEVVGKVQDQNVKGSSYVEMTGYAENFRKDI